MSDIGSTQKPRKRSGWTAVEIYYEPAGVIPQAPIGYQFQGLGRNLDRVAVRLSQRQPVHPGFVLAFQAGGVVAHRRKQRAAHPLS
jgi:hypothetical protein